jgi:hypothetical protein
MRWTACLLSAACCLAEVRTGRFHDRDAWTVESPRLRVTLLQSGGHVAEIVLKPGGVNPLWIQSRPTIDIEQYDPAKHQKLYGGTSEARLMSGLMGHNLCFPFWGFPSAPEAAAGMTFHGETGVTRWKQTAATEDSITVTAELPESRTRFTRTVRLAGTLVWFDETAENLSGWDRPVGWCEHVSMGPPFLESGDTVIEASLTRGRELTLTPGATPKEFTWPEGWAARPIDLRRVLTGDPPVMFVNRFLVDPTRQWGFFTAYRPKRRLVFGYAFPRAQFPWLNVWEANVPGMTVRAMEISNTPIPSTTRALVETPRMFDTPAFEWLDARGKLHKRLCAFSVRVPEGYAGVADVRVDGAALEIIERDTGRSIRVE